MPVSQTGKCPTKNADRAVSKCPRPHLGRAPSLPSPERSRSPNPSIPRWGRSCLPPRGGHSLALESHTLLRAAELRHSVPTVPAKRLPKALGARRKTGQLAAGAFGVLEVQSPRGPAASFRTTNQHRTPLAPLRQSLCSGASTLDGIFQKDGTGGALGLLCVGDAWSPAKNCTPGTYVVVLTTVTPRNLTVKTIIKTRPANRICSPGCGRACHRPSEGSASLNVAFQPPQRSSGSSSGPS